MGKVVTNLKSFSETYPKAFEAEKTSLCKLGYSVIMNRNFSTSFLSFSLEKSFRGEEKLRSEKYFFVLRLIVLFSREIKKTADFARKI